MTEQERDRVRIICDKISQRIEEKHIGCFYGSDAPLFFISTEYPGLWLEHVYDAVFYAKLSGKLLPERLAIAKNTIQFFMDNQTAEGQYPCYYRDPARAVNWQGEFMGYSHIQECVSFPALCLEVCRMAKDPCLTEQVYESAKKWDGWLRKYRMTRGQGLIEQFVGYDTGHDWSGRIQGFSCPGSYERDGRSMNAAILPQDDVVPVIAVDMNANFYGTQKALAALARLCGKEQEAQEWEKQAAEVKQRLFEVCYDQEDAFFYDVDKHGKKRKYLSSTIFHLFQEKVLDPDADGALIREIYTRHIKNPEEFWTAYPFPSMAVCDPSCEGHKPGNCWGYFSQALIALRCTRWMDDYGFGQDFDYICRKWLEAWTRCFDDMKLGQELDPFTGEPSQCSEWYSSCMLFYLYAAQRLGISDTQNRK